MPQNHPWTDLQRLESWAGEFRVNLIRLAALLGFYGHHLVNVYLLDGLEEMPVNYNLLVMLLVFSWGIQVLLMHLCLSHRWNPPALRFVVTGGDLVFNTLLLMIGGGPSRKRGAIDNLRGSPGIHLAYRARFCRRAKWGKAREKGIQPGF
jgi:hypothetical protein